MKKTNMLTYLFMACLTLLSACGDDEVLNSNKALLTAHEWKFSTCESEDEITVEFTNAFNAGARYTFLQNGTYSAKLGNVFNNVPYTGDWEFASDESQIILDKGTDEEITYTIETLSSTTLKLSEPGYTLVYIK